VSVVTVAEAPPTARGTARLGVGLWTFQSSATRPANLPSLYADFVEEARLLDACGYHSAWTAEHRIWYDSWCPALLHAMAVAVPATSSLRFANAMLLLPQHEPVALARNAATLDRLSGGRLQLGVGLGHRDAEYDALGLRRDRRGRLMDAALATVHEVWAGEHGDEPTARQPGPPLWIGGLAKAALERAVRGGHRIMLPQTVLPDELERYATWFREQAGPDAVVGVMRDVWVERDRGRAAAFEEAMVRHYREEAGAWWVLRGRVGFTAPDLLDAQMERVRRCALIGAPDRVAEGLAELFEAGADLVMVRLVFDFVDSVSLRQQIERVAADVADLLPEGRAVS
jgi:alkanesulfonate monooxygenase SsuD/methylene tetrahydromethanopterin reductase-like flavin-dependent oxidoreductase (luciferase family)